MNTKITFYPVNNGDCNLIEFCDGAKMMIDCKLSNKAEDDSNDDFNVINDLLTNKLKTKKHGLPYLDAFVLTHPDLDHCLGFKSKFYLKDPTRSEPTDKDKDDKLILIGELWYSPRIFTEHTDDLSDDAKAFKKEADRRMKLWKSNDSNKNKPGNRIRIIGYADIDKLDGIPSDRISAAGDELNDMDGKERDKYRFFIHAPFKKDIDGDNRNETSIVMQIRVDADSETDAGKIIFGGDAEWRIWKKIMEKTSDDKFLKWNLLETPHHCSYTFFADSRDDDPNQSSLDFLDKREGKGYIVSSSKTIKQNSDNPPCKKAKNRYIEHLYRKNEDYFCCTSEDDKHKPVIFEVTKSGISLFEEQKNEDKKSNNIGKREHMYG